MHRVVSQAKHTATVIMVIGLVVAAFPFLWILGSSIEGEHFPVTKNVQVQLISQTTEKMVFHATGNKVRDCKLIDIKVLVNPATNDIPYDPVRGVIYLINDGVGSIDHPLGQQDLGTWAVLPPGKKLKVQATYKCHSLWDTVTTLGTWEK